MYGIGDEMKNFYNEICAKLRIYGYSGIMESKRIATKIKQAL